MDAPTQDRRSVHWDSLADAIGDEDGVPIAACNALASDEFRLRVELGPMPYFGSIDTAPVVLLIACPTYVAGSSQFDHTFSRSGWPFAQLHPDAPGPTRDWWRERLGHLIAAFGAQAVANAVAAVALTPWASVRFDRDLRLPSRHRMLALGAAAARRGALIVITREPALWTEAPEIAALPPSQHLMPKSWRATHVDPASLGESWPVLCERVDLHVRTIGLTP